QLADILDAPRHQLGAVECQPEEQQHQERAEQKQQAGLAEADGADLEERCEVKVVDRRRREAATREDVAALRGLCRKYLSHRVPLRAVACALARWRARGTTPGSRGRACCCGSRRVIMAYRAEPADSGYARRHASIEAPIRSWSPGRRSGRSTARCRGS